MKLLYMLIAFGAGIASSVQSLFNGHWQERLDLKTVLLVNAMVVMAAAVVYYLIWTFRGEGRGDWSQLTPSILVGGACGIVVLAAMAIAFPRIGPLSTIVLFVAGQMIAAIAIGHFGILGMVQTMEWSKIIGTVLVAAGVYLVLR